MVYLQVKDEQKQQIIKILMEYTDNIKKIGKIYKNKKKIWRSLKNIEIDLIVTIHELKNE